MKCTSQLERTRSPFSKPPLAHLYVDCINLIFDFHLLPLGDFRDLERCSRRYRDYHIAILRFGKVCRDWYIVSTKRRSYGINELGLSSEGVGGEARITNLLRHVLCPDRGIFQLQIRTPYWSLTQNICLIEILKLSKATLAYVSLSLSFGDESDWGRMTTPHMIENIRSTYTKRMFPYLHLLHSLGTAQNLEELELTLDEQLPLEEYIK